MKTLFISIIYFGLIFSCKSQEPDTLIYYNQKEVDSIISEITIDFNECQLRADTLQSIYDSIMLIQQATLENKNITIIADTFDVYLYGRHDSVKVEIHKINDYVITNLQLRDQVLTNVYFNGVMESLIRNANGEWGKMRIDSTKISSWIENKY